MGEQLDKIKLSSDFVKKHFPKNFNPEIALIADNGSEKLFKDFKIISGIDFDNIPGFSKPVKKAKKEVLFGKIKGKDVIIYNGRYHYYEGVSMRDIAHTIYVLKYLGVKKILSVTEAGHLNPRFLCGDIALIYDHINLMGDNPLIGKNEDELGLRFPDMSNAYDREMHNKVYEVIQRNMLKVNDSALLGIIGPQSETEAEARFYRDIGADLVGYSIVPENITAVHCGIRFIAVALISRELVADKMLEDERSEKQKLKEQNKSLKEAESKLRKLIPEIIKSIQ